MIITEHDGFTGKSHQILISQNDDLDVWEIAECFKKQYPKRVCAISFSRVVQVECEIILVGLNIGRKIGVKRK